MKTVYILGAGFSIDAGAPSQASILSEAFKLHEQDPSIFNGKIDILKEFLIAQLNVTENQFDRVELEDIFTPLDRCLTENSQYRGISLDKILVVRQAVFYVIGKTIKLLLDRTEKSKEYIDKFAKHLTDLSSVRAKGVYSRKDPVSVISANWDILLDNSIHNYIYNEYHKKAVVDYCCYISSIDECDETVKPGLEILGEGGFNVKLLKLHGSLNWLQCPRCMRLYVKFYSKSVMDNFDYPKPCRHCDTNFKEETGKHTLTANLIMPTYIKDLSNPQYKIIWQNAGIEISEADKLVFIGYSLPSADFEMRQLLSRMTRKNAAIEVVDYSDNTDVIKNERIRWKQFFGNRDVSFNFEGAQKYIDKLTTIAS